MKVHVEVTQEDIAAAGKPPIKEPHLWCPVARAVSRALAVPLGQVTVDGADVSLYAPPRTHNEDEEYCYPYSDAFWRVELDGPIQDWIHDWDTKKPVDPIGFDFDVPEAAS